jgi:predicted DNA-binding protein (UPF0251 family)
VTFGPSPHPGPRGRRGRRRAQRQIDGSLRYRCFSPVCSDAGTGTVILRRDELELIRLIDILGLTQEETAAAVGVSRKTVWRDLHEARRKIALALVEGRAIRILECDEQKTAFCPPLRDESGTDAR